MSVIKNHTVVIDTAKILNERSIHNIFASKFGFFDGYGRNWDAMYDVMGSMTDTSSGLSEFRLKENETLTLQLKDSLSFKERSPKVYRKLCNLVFDINNRYLDSDETEPFILEEL